MPCCSGHQCRNFASPAHCVQLRARKTKTIAFPCPRNTPLGACPCTGICLRLALWVYRVLLFWGFWVWVQGLMPSWTMWDCVNLWWLIGDGEHVSFMTGAGVTLTCPLVTIAATIHSKIYSFCFLLWLPPTSVALLENGSGKCVSCVWCCVQTTGCCSMCLCMLHRTGISASEAPETCNKVEIPEVSRHSHASLPTLQDVGLLVREEVPSLENGRWGASDLLNSVHFTSSKSPAESESWNNPNRQCRGVFPTKSAVPRVVKVKSNEPSVTRKLLSMW